MRSFSILLVESLLSLSFAVAFTVPSTLHENHQLIARAGPEGERPAAVIPGRPLPVVEFPKEGPMIGSKPSKVLGLLKKLPGWHPKPIQIYRTRDPEALPKEGEATDSYIISTVGADGKREVDVVVLDRGLVIGRQLHDDILSPDTAKGMRPLKPGAGDKAQPRVFYAFSNAGRFTARYQSLLRRLGPKDPEHPVEGADVKIGSLRSITTKASPMDQLQGLSLFNAMVKEAQGSSVKLHHGTMEANIPPDLVLMAPPPKLGPVVARPFKALWTNFQTVSRVISNRIGRTIQAGPAEETAQIERRSFQQQSQRRIKRGNTLTTISGIENGAATGITNTTDDLSASFAEYYMAFLEVQANSTALIMPFLEEMTNATNSSLLFDAAWSIWNDLTGQAEYTAGPFLYGMHCLDQIEDEYLQQNNLTTNSPEYLDLLALDAVLIEAYQTAWNKSSAALQQSGLSDQLVQLAAMMKTTDSAILPANFNTTEGVIYDDQFFVPGNTTS